MTSFVFENFINTTLAGSITSSATTMTLSSSVGLPASIPSGYVMAFIINDVATRQNYEVVYAPAQTITGATLTIIRGQEGTTPLAWATLDYVYSSVTAGQMASFANLNGSPAQIFNVAPAVAANQAVQLGQVGGPNRTAEFTSNGTFTVPAGVTKVLISGCAGGGGGGGSNSGNTPGGGGGGGGVALKTSVTVTPSAPYTVTIGAAGAGGTSSTAGIAGGASSFGSLVTLTGGGGGGFNGGASSGGTAGNSLAQPGAPGVVSTVYNAAPPGGGGRFGQGGQPNGPNNAGNDASGYGGGGGGANDAAGGNGTPGIIIVEY